MGTGNLAPDHTDLGSTNLLLSPVNVRNLLAKVEAVSAPVSVISHSPCYWAKTHLAALVSSTPSILIKLVLGVGGPSATLVAEVATPTQQIC